MSVVVVAVEDADGRGASGNELDGRGGPPGVNGRRNLCALSGHREHGPVLIPRHDGRSAVPTGVHDRASGLVDQGQ